MRNDDAGRPGGGPCGPAANVKKEEIAELKSMLKAWKPWL